MNVLLIDADSSIPNLALMKLSTYHKNLGHKVELVRVNLPYYPSRKKRQFTVSGTFDRIYCSVIFEGNKEYIKGEDIIFGGTGHNLKTVLSNDIEECSPDYSIYPDNKQSYGFITRGCIRKCEFCKVPEKEGEIRKVAEISDIVKHKKVLFLDNNILAYPEHKKVLQELITRNIKSKFYQGLDIRLVDEENSKLLSELRYIGEYIFAFDDWKYRDVIHQKLKLLSWRKPFQFKFFIYVHPNMDLVETINRIKWLKTNECLPYIMRDIACWDSESVDFFTDLASYCNQVFAFKKLEFCEFIRIRHTNTDRISSSINMWLENNKEQK